jgi:hypothetical protein
MARIAAMRHLGISVLLLVNAFAPFSQILHAEALVQIWICLMDPLG